MISYVHLQCVYVFCYVFSVPNKAVQTAVIFGVGSLVAQILVHAPVDLTRSRLLGLRYVKRLAGKWNGYLYQQLGAICQAPWPTGRMVLEVSNLRDIERLYGIVWWWVLREVWVVHLCGS